MCMWCNKAVPTLDGLLQLEPLLWLDASHSVLCSSPGMTMCQGCITSHSRSVSRECRWSIVLPLPCHRWKFALNTGRPHRANETNTEGTCLMTCDHHISTFLASALPMWSQVTLQGGDELLLSGQEPYSFVFQPSDPREASSAGGEAGGSGSRAKQPRSAAPHYLQSIIAEHTAALATQPPSLSFITASNFSRLKGRPEIGGQGESRPRSRAHSGEGEESGNEERATPPSTLDPASDAEATERVSATHFSQFCLSLADSVAQW